MNPLREMILNKIVKPEIKAASKIFLGSIESIDVTTNRANVRLGANADELYEGVPFSRGASYIHGAEPRVGTPVIVSFLNGDMSYPYILSILGDDVIDPATGKSFMMPENTYRANRMQDKM